MKNIPPGLLDHLSQTATTWCYLLKIECRGTWQGTVLGFADLDADIVYDDGQGEVTYSSSNGFSPDRIEQFSDITAVDNSVVNGWISESGITTSQILAGVFDYANVSLYRVNYRDLSMGHEVVDYGTCGETKFSGNKWAVEFRGLGQQAKQIISQQYSLTCRAAFGDAKCKMPFVWSPGSVSALGSDNTREFIAVMAHADGWFDGGVLEWLTGNNAGAQMEVDTFVADSLDREFTLVLPMPLPIQNGDTFRVRRDCGKTFQDCKDYDNVLNFRGEHLTPVSDPGVMVPGANIARL